MNTIIMRPDPSEVNVIPVDNIAMASMKKKQSAIHTDKFIWIVSVKLRLPDIDVTQIFQDANDAKSLIDHINEKI